jgi:hypothetical protein
MNKERTFPMTRLRPIVATVVLVLFGVGITLMAHATLSLPGVNGPFLGDQNTNLYSVANAINNFNQLAFTPAISASQTSGQANCTQLTTPLNDVTVSASTGYVCLPTATGGRVVWIYNISGQTIDIYSSAASFTPGTADTINNTAGTIPYTPLVTTAKVMCFSPANGVWACSEIA